MKKPKKRSHARAPGRTQTSISLKVELLLAAKLAAEKESRSFSNWLEILLKDKLATLEPSMQESKSGSTEVEAD
jgi:hypothetical protein